MKDILRQIDWLPAWVSRARLHSADDPQVARLNKASIGAASIQPPARRDPRDDAGLVESAPLSANIPLSPAAGRPYASKPERLGAGIRLRPLSGFSWGGNARRIGGAALPRVSAEHLLIWLARGSLRIELPRLYHAQREGQLAFIPAGTAFALWQGPFAEGEVLSIPPAVQRQLAAWLPQNLLLGRPQASDIAALRRAMTELSQIKLTPVSRGIGGEPLAVLAFALGRLQSDEADQPQRSDDPRHARQLTERYLTLARRDLGRGLTIADLAQNLGVSMAVLDRACRHSRGRSALDLLYDLRLERAVQMLSGQRDLSPNEIALMLGYASLGHMNRAFVAATGRGPDYFRHRGEEGTEDI